ncbi:exodeoxyribonuclease V subunit alpha [Buchnera aphidicola]|uniref:exodeoxyribonuclease V subunit alpha n=1 Tax=Buchnera aphidicola TaxID=9 RepID=UPI003463864A
MNLLLKNACKKKIIRLIDFYFAEYIANNNPAIMLIAACVSYENQHGHTFLSLNYFKQNCFFSQKNPKFIKKILNSLGNTHNWLNCIAECSAIGNGSVITPLVFYDNKIYLYKMWKAEKNILKFLYEKNIINNINIEQCFKVLEKLFPQDNNHDQKIAVALSLIRNITFIIGGPGTGKTTTILKIIIAFIKTSKNPIKIQLAAPTGKAVNRLIEVIRNDIFNRELNEKEKKNVPSTAITIHKLLKIQKISQKNFFNSNNLLKLDLLIVDESSMIDMLIMEKLLFSLSKNTKIIFIGDYNQLPPIEAGFILRDLCYYYQHGYSIDVLLILQKITKCLILKCNNNKKSFFISNNICILKKNYRFYENSGIHTLSKAIFYNKKEIIQKTLNNQIPNVFFFTVKNNQEYNNMIDKIAKRYEYYWMLILKKEKIHLIIKEFQNFQVLCILRNSEFGVSGLNEHLEYQMYKKRKIKFFNKNEKIWYVGKPIMITKNNQYLGLYNGNIGITNTSKNGILQVSFLEKNNLTKNIPVDILKDYETAWALTVHKAQGSEFKNIILVLPNTSSRILNKDVLYTAVTRSKKTVSIYSKINIFIEMAGRKDEKERNFNII